MRRKIIILTEGAKDKGLGHISRCLAIYQEFEKLGYDLLFLVNGDESIINMLENTNYQIFNWITNSEKMFKLIENDDVAIIDSYLAPKTLYNEIYKKVKLCVCLDDNNRIEYPGGVVINGNIYAKELNYPKEDSKTYLLGTDYTPLRKEFWEVPSKEIKKDIESVMVTFGGDDCRQMTQKILKILIKDQANLIKNIIIGKGFSNIEEIKQSSDDKTNLIYYPDASTMKKIMLESDIAISAGGQTIYELARTSTPAIIITVADNQSNNVRIWQETGFIEYVGSWDDKDLIINIGRSLNLLKDRNIRKKKTLIGKKIINGQGTINLVESLLTIFSKKQRSEKD